MFVKVTRISRLHILKSGAPRGFGDLGRMAIYLQGAGSTGYYFRGAREQAHNFGDTGSLAKKKKNKEKPPFCLIF